MVAVVTCIIPPFFMVAVVTKRVKDMEGRLCFKRWSAKCRICLDSGCVLTGAASTQCSQTSHRVSKTWRLVYYKSKIDNYVLILIVLFFFQGISFKRLSSIIECFSTTI